MQKISRFYPSSQTCSCRGHVNPEVKDLDIREWICPKCSAHHLRDLNAAINIRNESLRLIAAAGTTEAQSASGDGVRPGDIQETVDEGRITRLQVV
ncbi:MAG: transposase [Chroococcidiopsidaceae cyanobacterium CP_BM_RX_35]|nr:transposase [Chroococcidiopsidaceae cyanobacterium CP_BM_RX_35]